MILLIDQVVSTLRYIRCTYWMCVWHISTVLSIISVLSLSRTPISAKYCWFGWWLGAWSTSSHLPTLLCDVYIFRLWIYTLISEWTRLFGLLRILDNLISSAVCYFLYDYFCILWNIHLTHARSCSCRHTLSWVVFMPSSRVGLVYLSPSILLYTSLYTLKTNDLTYWSTPWSIRYTCLYDWSQLSCQ